MLEVKNLTKTYQETVLSHVNISFNNHGFYVITGQSGSGKSTLLHILGGLDSEYEGDIVLDGMNIREIKNYVQNYIGFVFQDFNLIEAMNIQNNILLPSYFKKFEKNWKTESQNMNITEFKKKTSILSRGQKQRVSLLRAVLAKQPIILLDEPTGSLDEENAHLVFQMLKEIAQEKLVIVVSHDLKLARQYGDYIYEMKNHQPVLVEEKSHDMKQFMQKDYMKHSFVQFLFLYFRTYLKNHFFLVQGLTLALLCVLITFSFTEGLKNEIHQQLETIIPTNLIMARKKNGQDMSLNELQSLNDQTIIHRFLDCQEVELLGLSTNNEYKESKTLYLNDYTQKCMKQLYKGKKASSNNEVIVSKSTYENLLYLMNRKSLLNKEIYLYLKYQNNIKSYKVKITGISDENTAMDVIYFKEYAYSHICERLFDLRNGDMALLQVNIDDYKHLEKRYSHYEFQQANASLKSSIDQTFEKTTSMLYVFSSLAVVSSLWLVFVVFYLFVIKKRRFFALLKTMGAGRGYVMMLVLLQGLGIALLSFVEAMCVANVLFGIVNGVMESIVGMNLILTFDVNVLIIVAAGCTICMFASLLIPAYMASRVNVVKTLQKY